MSLITSETLCFDIGAHHGESARAFLEAGAGYVVSVEPDKQNFEILDTWAREQPKVTAVRSAAGDQPILRLYRCDEQDGLCTAEINRWKRIYPERTFSGVQLVPCLTLDALCTWFWSNRPKGINRCVIKVDAEGHEIHVLGRSGFLTNLAVEAVIFEYHRDSIQDAVTILRILASKGFCRAVITEDDVDLMLAPSGDINDAIFDLMERNPQWGNITVTR